MWSPFSIGCSVSEAAPCALEAHDSIGGTRGGAPAFSTAGGAELEEAETERERERAAKTAAAAAAAACAVLKRNDMRDFTQTAH
ncbi:hypothetical protein INR49_025473 [Caranx melampygus]|nr:hypothetical protein INR49_025473 [Caranx melampygus]